MALPDVIRGEFIDIIDWTELARSDVLACRFNRRRNEIKMSAKLTVREGQVAAFINEGQLADVFPPGMYTLSTQNLPVLATLKGWKYGFQSPFKAEVYFVSTRQWTDRRWGTQNPILIRDREFGPVRVRAFGTYAFHICDAAVFLRQVVATNPSFETYEISGQLRNTIVARFTDVIAQSRIPVVDLAGNYEKLAVAALEAMKADLSSIGLALTLFYIENISFPSEVEQAIDKRTQINVLGDLDKFARYETAKAIGDAARNPGGVAGIGAGLAVGVAMAGRIANELNQSAPPDGVKGAASPPPLPPTNAYFTAINNQQSGPHDLVAIRDLISAALLSPKSLVWRSGMADWMPAETVPEITPLFARGVQTGSEK